MTILDDMAPIPKCSVAGCRLWVWNAAPTRVDWVDWRVVSVAIGPRRPLSDKCWYHHHGNQPPAE